jgi:hypothetical protein
MAELQHDGKCKNDYKSGAIVFTGGTSARVGSEKQRDECKQQLGIEVGFGRRIGLAVDVEI